MNQSPTQPQSRLKKPDEISRWTKRYAQNRSLGVLICLAIFVALYAAISVGARLAGEAYRSGSMPTFYASVALLVLASGAIVYFSVPWWGGKLLQRLVQRVYSGEGNVAFSPPGGRTIFLVLALAICFGVCVIASVAAGFLFDIPEKYIQPISALIVAPFLVSFWLLTRPMAGYPALLWPALYAAHALLILAGAPILLTGPWGFLNVLLPMAGYGVLAGLVGHAYSRFALGRLRKLSQSNEALSSQGEKLGGP